MDIANRLDRKVFDRTSFRLTLAILVFGIALTACTAETQSYQASGSQTSTPTPTPTPAPTSIPTPTVSLQASPTSLTSGGSTTLSWTTTNATSCSASGAWSGSEPVSSTGLAVGPLSTNSTFTLTCTGAGGTASQSVSVVVAAASVGTATLTWTAPTTNVDGTTANIASFNIYSGTSASNLLRIANVGWSTTLYTAQNLATGTYYFAVTAVGVDGSESAFSNIGSKTIN